MIYPDYKDSITNLANSILKYFEIETKHNTISDVDNFLNEGKTNNVAVILFDGMGYNLINRLLDENTFLR